MLRHARYLAALLPFFALAGCGGPAPTPVSGTITVKKKPAANLLIQFTPVAPAGDKPTAGNATSAEGGAFEIRGDNGQPGLPPGEYFVTVADRNLDIEDADLGNGKRIANRVAKKYATVDEKANPLKVKVEAGKTKYDLELD